MAPSAAQLLLKNEIAKLKNGTEVSVAILKDDNNMFLVSFSGSIVQQFTGRSSLNRDLWPDVPTQFDNKLSEKCHSEIRKVQLVAKDLFAAANFYKENANSHHQIYTATINEIMTIIATKARIFGRQAILAAAA